MLICIKCVNSSLFQSRPTRKKYTLLFNIYYILSKKYANTYKFTNNLKLHILLYHKYKTPFIYYTFARLSPSFYSKIILLNSMKILTYFYTKNVILSFVIFRMILMSQKKEEVYNILIINNLYINIYFFASNFWKND